MDFSKLLRTCYMLKVVTRIFQNCFMGLSKLPHGFVKVFTWICQCFSLFSCHLTSKTNISKLVESSALKVLIASGLLYLWQCFMLWSFFTVNMHSTHCIVLCQSCLCHRFCFLIVIAIVIVITTCILRKEWESTWWPGVYIALRGRPAQDKGNTALT